MSSTRRAVGLALVGLLVGTLLGLLLVQAPVLQDDANPPFRPQASVAQPRAGASEFVRAEGSVPMGAGYCLYPVTGCQNAVGTQWRDVRLADAPGATRVVLWLNWTPAGAPRTPATGRLQLALVACGSVQGCGQNPTVLARATMAEDPSVNGGNHSLKLDASLEGKKLPESLVARISSDEGGLPSETSPHVSADQPFRIEGFVLR